MLADRREGLTYDQLQAKYGWNRATLCKHFKRCLAMEHNVSSDARRRNDIERRELAGDIRGALKKAQLRLDRADESGNMRLILQAQAGVAKLLGMKARSIPRMSAARGVPSSVEALTPPIWADVIVFPGGTDEQFARKFGGLVKGSPAHAQWLEKLQRGRKMIVPTVRWIDPHAAGPDELEQMPHGPETMPATQTIVAERLAGQLGDAEPDGEGSRPDGE
jgi:hypothetical protein